MVKKIQEAEFEQVKNSPLALVDFSATWCGPCKMLAPVLENVSEELGDKMAFFNMDVDECPNMAAVFGIQAVPTIVILKNGEEIGRETGFKPELQLKAAIEAYLA